MLILIPIYQNLKVVGRHPFCLELPHCNRLETHLGTTYRVFTEDKFIKLFVGKDGNDFKFSWVSHDQANETETHKPELLGTRWKRSTMGNVEAIETEMEDYEMALARMITVLFSEYDGITNVSTITQNP